MAITDQTKIDYLWKKIAYGVTETTASGKQATEENIPSPSTILGHQIWSQSDLIPVPADVSSVVEFVDVKLVADPSVTTRQAWFALADSDQPISTSNRLVDFIQFTVDPGYEVRVFSDEEKTSRLLPGTPGSEWVFDYSAGVLYFANPLPGNITELYLTGYRYVGTKGVSQESSNVSSGLVLSTLTYEVNLNQYEQHDFELATGSEFFLVDLEVSYPVTIRSHITSSREGSPQYSFVASSSHLIDDGSYVVGGERYYGPRQILLVNTGNPSSGKSYWTVTPNSSFLGPLTIKLRYLRFGAA